MLAQGAGGAQRVRGPDHDRLPLSTPEGRTRRPLRAPPAGRRDTCRRRAGRGRIGSGECVLTMAHPFLDSEAEASGKPGKPVAGGTLFPGLEALSDAIWSLAFAAGCTREQAALARQTFLRAGNEARYAL